MNQYNILNVKLPKSQLNKLKSGMKNGTEVTLNLSSSVVGDSNDETTFARKLSLTDTQILRIRKAFANGSFPNIKFSKTQLSKMVELRDFLGRLLGSLLKNHFVFNRKYYMI